MRDKAILFGPFFGEASWEYFRFSPYAIYMKKTNPDSLLIALTRESRFDLYGQWADILVPLKIKDEKIYTQKAFKLLGYDIETCKRITELFRVNYKKKYRVKDHYIPDVSSLRYKLKWQYPRDKMDYDFRPRRANHSVVNEIVKEKEMIVVDEGYTYISDTYDIVNINNFIRTVKRIIKEGYKITFFGCLIELLKKSKFVVSNLDSDIGRLSVLLQTPLIYPNRDISTDNVMLLNPENTPIIDCKNISEGVNIYENII
jgi:hypothetical protein